MIQHSPINLSWGKILKENPDRMEVVAAKRFFEMLYNIVFPHPKVALRTTMHWQNTGLNVGTSSSAILQVWFGARPFSFDLCC